MLPPATDLKEDYKMKFEEAKFELIEIKEDIIVTSPTGGGKIDLGDEDLD